MDASEAIVKKSLKHMEFQSVVYEPDGNVPPDFLANGRVAVENHFASAKIMTLGTVSAV